ncbi:MAG TPA: iron ABC transporter permease [Rectinemataceae bacterium]|nr:iron ABC transporter permease [Rectinemataceae bacterium]
MKAPRSIRLTFAVLLAATLVLYLFAGRYPGPGFMKPSLLFSDETARRIFLSIRLPRALGAILLGAVLGGSGAAFQAIFGNPLVDSGFLGVSQGAAFGAAMALVAGSWQPLKALLSGFALNAFVSLSSFAMALAALGASLALSKRFRFGGQVLRLILAGLAVSAFFSSLLAAVKYVADPLSQLPDIVFWTMGSLTAMGWQRFWTIAPISLFSLGFLYLMRWRATLLSLDDEVSRSMGLRPEIERAAIAMIAATGVAAVTAACGIVSWIGLVVPHVARLYAGSEGRNSIPLSMAGGAIFALAADGLARTLFPGELPLGIVTALLGAIAFCALLASRSTELAR